MDSMIANATRVYFDLPSTIAIIASGLGLAQRMVRGVINLLSGSCTIPFVARYRKDTTGGLNEVQVEAIEDALAPTRKLINRKNRVRIRIRRALQPGDLIAI